MKQLKPIQKENIHYSKETGLSSFKNYINAINRRQKRQEMSRREALMPLSTELGLQGLAFLRHTQDQGRTEGLQQRWLSFPSAALPGSQLLCSCSMAASEQSQPSYCKSSQEAYPHAGQQSGDLLSSFPRKAQSLCAS